MSFAAHARQWLFVPGARPTRARCRLAMASVLFVAPGGQRHALGVGLILRINTGQVAQNDTKTDNGQNMTTTRFLIGFVAALGCGLMAGLFFAFSISVMGALRRLPANEGMAAMQAINVAIVNPLFLVVFLGTAISCIAAVLIGLRDMQNPMAYYLVVGGVLYLVGSLLVTAVFNIPRNNALAGLNATDVANAEAWQVYLKEWTMWNHVRGVAAFAAMAALMMGLRS